MKKDKWKDRIRLTLFIASCIVLAAALVLPGCNTWQLPQAKSQARQKAALIADKKVELKEKAIELESLIEEHEKAPTPETKKKVEEKAVEVNQLSKETAAEIRGLAELTASIADSEIVIKETTEQVTGVAAYLPSPWREGVVLLLGIGGTLIKARSTAKVTAQAQAARRQVHDLAIEVSSAARAEDEAVIASIVTSLDKVLTAGQKKKLSGKMGPAAEAAVQKAKGRV